MSDIVERLTAEATFRDAGRMFDDRVTLDILREAAAEIERLREALNYKGSHARHNLDGVRIDIERQWKDAEAANAPPANAAPAGPKA